MSQPLVAVASDSPEAVVDALQSSLSIEFEARDSGYWGVYWLARLPSELRVYLNQDPLFNPDTDPAEEYFFEPSFGSCGVLVSAVSSGDKFNALADLLVRAFPGSQVRR